MSGRPEQALTWGDRAVTSTVPGAALRPMAQTAQAYALSAAGRTAEGLAVLGFLPGPGNEVPMTDTDALIMRGMLRVYVDELPGATADLCCSRPSRCALPGFSTPGGGRACSTGGPSRRTR